MQHLALKAAIVLLATALRKPGQRSKAKEHQECLEKRLTLWRNGEIESLLREGRMIQRRLLKSNKNDPPNKARIFAKLVMEGQINSALRYLSKDDSGGVLLLTDDVVRQLREKHPDAQRAKLGSLLFGPVEDMPDSVYQEINGEFVREVALRTKGSGGPSGVDANGFKRILASKSFKRSSINLCESIATLTRRLCTEFVDLLTIEPILASRLIPLDKGNGEVRPIDLVALPVHMGGLGLINPSDSVDAGYSASIRVSAPLVTEIEAQSHETPDETEVQRLVYATRKEKDDGLKEELEEVKARLPDKTQRAVDLACEKGASNWLTVIPLKDMDFDLNKREFRDAVRLRYDWPIPDQPSVCVCGSMFTVDHAMICKRGGLVIQRHNEIRDLQAELLDMVCYDVQVEPALQPITGEELDRGANQAPDARLDVHCRGFWERQRAAFFDIRVCHPNADSYKDLSPKQIYRIHENEKKRKYNSRVTEIEQGTFTPLVFTTTGGMADECLRYHSRLAELLSAKKQESYATTISWVRAKVSFAILRSALLCLRGSRTPRRRNLDVKDRDLEIEKGQAGL